MSPEAAGLQRSFALDSDILAPGSAVDVDLSASTEADVALAILTDGHFPARESGEIAVASIGLSVSGNNPLAFSGSGATVGFELPRAIWSPRSTNGSTRRWIGRRSGSSALVVKDDAQRLDRQVNEPPPKPPPPAG